MVFDCRPKVLHRHCLQFLLGVKMAPRETENNAYAKFWGDKQRTLWYVMVFLEWSIEASLHLLDIHMKRIGVFLRKTNTLVLGQRSYVSLMDSLIQSSPVLRTPA